jgi:hypothetical protein
MRVLMFGWDFPPFQAGGLATATLGLVKGLLGRGVEVTLVVPFAAPTAPVIPNLRPGWTEPSGASAPPTLPPRRGLLYIPVSLPLHPNRRRSC